MYEWLESKRTKDWKEEQKEAIKIEGMANGDKLIENFVPYILMKNRDFCTLYKLNSIEERSCTT